MVAKYFGTVPFANAGDKAAIPITTQPDGSVSYNQGWGPDYELPYANPLAKDIPRDQSNQLYFDITGALGFVQLNGAPEWTPAADNGGVAVSYPLGARVSYLGSIYQSISAANTALPTDPSAWILDISGRLINIRHFNIVGVTPYVETPGTNRLFIRVVAGGGAGGGSVASGAGQCSAGAGGGAGGYAERFVTGGFAGANITVGAGGLGTNGGAGNPGGSSSFGALLSATGGSGAAAGILAADSPVTMNGAASGGTGSGGPAIGVGGQGLPAFYAPVPISGKGGMSVFGEGGGIISTVGGAHGNNAISTGAGGGGAVTAAGNGFVGTGGNGAQGEVIVYEFS